MDFKKLSDVEVVAEPIESANVLIEEDGVIKKAPKTAVGGAGGGIVIHFTINEDDELEIPVFDFNEIKSSILNGINVVCFERNPDGEYYSFVIDFIEDDRITFSRGEDESLYLYSDNTARYSC